MEGIDFLESTTPVYKELKGRYSDIDGFRVLEKDELPTGVKFGASYTTWCMNTPVYCAYLFKKFVLNGGICRKLCLERLEEAFDAAKGIRTVINCSGTGFGDPLSFITRGQTCLVSNKATMTITRQNSDGSWTFVIPRPLNGGTIIGGTKEENDMTVAASSATRERLLDAVSKCFPELLNANGKFDVIKDIVGRRPTRGGGMRLEVEKIKNNRFLVHAYGAGGRGVEMFNQ